jgi:hypothetical protein
MIAARLDSAEGSAADHAVYPKALGEDGKEFVDQRADIETQWNPSRLIAPDRTPGILQASAFVLQISHSTRLRGSNCSCMRTAMRFLSSPGAHGLLFDAAPLI